MLQQMGMQNAYAGSPMQGYSERDRMLEYINRLERENHSLRVGNYCSPQTIYRDSLPARIPTNKKLLLLTNT